MTTNCLCFQPPTREGKQQFILQTAHRDYNLAFGGPSTDPAAFYLCYRATVCGINQNYSRMLTENLALLSFTPAFIF